MKRSDEEIQLIRDWLKLARENLQVAKSAMTTEFAPYHTVCFLCQSSSERYLKAYLIYRRWELKKTHDLNELLTYCVDYEAQFETLRDASEILNEYITSARYPGDIPFESFTKSQAKEAIDSADQVERFTVAQIDLPQVHPNAQSSIDTECSDDKEATG